MAGLARETHTPRACPTGPACERPLPDTVGAGFALCEDDDFRLHGTSAALQGAVDVSQRDTRAHEPIYTCA